MRHPLLRKGKQLSIKSVHVAHGNSFLHRVPNGRGNYTSPALLDARLLSRFHDVTMVGMSCRLPQYERVYQFFCILWQNFGVTPRK